MHWNWQVVIPTKKKDVLDATHRWFVLSNGKWIVLTQPNPMDALGILKVVSLFMTIHSFGDRNEQVQT